MLFTGAEYMNRMLGRPLFVGIIGIFLLYCVGSVADIGLLADFGAPAVELLVAAVLFHLCFHVKRFRIMWFFFGLTCLAYGLSDVLWLYWDNALHIDPEEVAFFYYAYLVPNITIMLGTFAFYSKLGYKWNKRQLVLDISAVTIPLAIGFWLLFLRGWAFADMIADPYILALFFYLIVDFVTVAISLAMIQFHGIQQTNASIRLMMAGVFVYFTADLMYIYQVKQDTYIPNEWTDILFVLSMVLFGLGGVKRFMDPEGELHYNLKSVLDIGYTKPGFKILWLFVLPFLLFLAGYQGPYYAIIVLSVVVLYFLISGFIYNAVRTESLLKKELELNADLEDQVQARVAELQAAYEELDEIVKLDSLTGLANRRHFLSWLDGKLDAMASGDRMALFYIDIDKFKAINDAYGHEVGDLILVEFAHRLNGWKRDDMFLARISSDEYVVSVSNFDTWEQLARHAQEIVALADRELVIRGYHFRITVSIGIALYPEDAQDRVMLVQNADIAMFHAKELKSGHVSFYSSWFSDAIRRRQELDLKLRNADFDSEFQLHYQPQFSTMDRHLIGMEALIRWEPEPGIRVTPVEFIPLAEENGLIIPIGEWVITTAIRQIGIWNAQYGLSLRMGINISPKQFHSGNLFSHIEACLTRHDVKPKWIDIEITESSAMNTDSSSEQFMMELARMGMSISIDDFGTGYSSLNYIKRFDIDALKIAKPLIDNIADEEGSSQIVLAITSMARTMNLRTIAEGVETESQLECLKRVGCAEIQGYLLGKPATAAEFEECFIKPHLKNTDMLE